MKPERKIVIEHRLAPGDITCTTALVRDIKLVHGDRYAIDFRTNFPTIYDNNPHLTPLSESDSGVEKIVLCYKSGIISAGRGNHHHFITWFHKDFEKKTGIHVDCMRAECDLHLSEEERKTAPISGRYWAIFGGGKTDITLKHWDFSRYQEVVNRLRIYGIRFAQCGAAMADQVHPRMKNVLNLVGWGSVRHLLWQLYHCEGIICPITCAMHMASAFHKPCVVIAGGREEPWWESYCRGNHFGEKSDPVVVPHEYLHTVGLLDCCKAKGCWRNKIIKINRDTSLCHKISSRATGAQPLPECMNMITVDHVVEAVMRYYESGTLPPIGMPRREMLSWYEKHNPAQMPPNVQTSRLS